MGAEVEPLKLGRKHLSRHYRRQNVMAVAEREKLATGAQEIDLQHQQPESSPATTTKGMEVTRTDAVRSRMSRIMEYGAATTASKEGSTDGP